MSRARLCGCLLVASTTAARADDVLHLGTPAFDPPTLVALGLSVPITGDDNFTAAIAVRYRVTGATAWRDAMPLVHVHAEAVTGLTVAPQFAGSILDLAPDTAYDIELHASDADGAVDTTLMLSAHTRPVPIAEPAHPRVVAVTDLASLNTALAAAQPGDEIELANGTYAGLVSITASGTATDPIVIRGASEDEVFLDGGGCTGCNVIEVYGSFVHLENLTIQHASRGLRFQTAGATDNVVRRVHIRDVTLGIGSQPDQQGFYYADNILEGRIVWPCIYASTDPACNTDPSSGTVTPGLHANDDGIHLEGNGHTVAHNQLSGFGDAMKIQEDGAVSVDFYGNDVLWSYDNALELDSSARNTRSLRNRFTNSYDPISFQPIFGGPSYSIRDVFVNVADEQFKLHSNGAVPTVGAVILHATVVRSTRALQIATDIAPLDFTIENSLFIGPTALDPDGHTVRWDVPGVATATLDYNGYYPDGMFEYGYSGFGTTYPSFAALVASATFDTHSVLVDPTTLAGGLVGPADFHSTVAPTVPLLADGSPAIDRGLTIPNVDDGYLGAAPDLGAIEHGCAAPLYGPRPVGTDETNEPLGCAAGSGSAGNDAGIGGDPGGSGGGGCCGATDDGSWLICFGVVALCLGTRNGSRRSRS
jgi:hypothetical protein